MKPSDAAVWRVLGAGDHPHLVRGAWTLCGRVAGQARGRGVQAGVDLPPCRICATIGPDRYTVGELTSLGLTTRQIHHWCERGWLQPDRALRGMRTFTREERDVAAAAVKLIRIGYRTEAALQIARGARPGEGPAASRAE